MKHEEIIACVWLEPFGLLDAAELEAVSAHFEGGCAACASAARSARRFFEGWCSLTDTLDPSSDLRTHILDSMRRHMARN
jgi:hypothetical protein